DLVARQRRAWIDPQRALEQLEAHGIGIGAVHQTIDHRNAGETPHHIGTGEHPIAQRRLAGAGAHRLRSQHQMRKIHVPRMWRHIGTFCREADVAQVAVVDHLPVDTLVDAVDLQGRRGIDGVEQRRKGIAQVEAATAAVTDLEDPRELLLERSLVVEARLAPLQWMANGSRKAALAVPVRLDVAQSVSSAAAQSVSSAFWKRLACERSALARVSNQSAISLKPSSRAAFAMPGYISEYSWVSPAIADFKFSFVSPIGSPVAGSPTCSRYSRCPWAWPVSPSAVERNTAETSLKPSTSALAAKYR